MTEAVFITGASGFVGRHVAERCLSKGWDVVGLTRPGRKSMLPTGVCALDVDVADERSVEEAVRKARPTLVLHLAAYGVAPSDRNAEQMQRVNVDLGAVLARAAAEVGAVLVSTGSSSEYAGNHDRHLLAEDAPLEAGKLYGASKAAGGLLAMATAAAMEVPTRHLRLFNIYGTGEAPHRLLPSLLARRGGRDRIALSAGLQVRDFLHVTDAVDGILHAATRLLTGTIAGARAVNLCTGAGMSVRDFVLIAAEALGISDDRLGFGDLPMRPDEIPHLVGDPARMRFDLDWTPSFDAAAGIREVIARV